MKHFLLLFAFFAIPWLAKAYDFSATTPENQYGITLYYQINPDNNSVSVAQPAEPYNYTVVEIPEKVSFEGKQYNVTGIGASAFYQSTIREISIPASIENIMYSAFSNSSVASVTISNNSSMKTIGNLAFEQCTKLNAINLPQGLASIGENAFRNTYALKNIELPNSLRELGSGAFYGSGLIEVEIPGTIETIPSDAFIVASNLSKVVINEGVKNIANSAFSRCGITTVSLPESLETIGERGFYENPIETINWPSSLKSIGSQAFYRNSLTEIVLPDNLTELGNNCFEQSSKLSRIVFSKGMTYLPSGVCSQCAALASVEIPEGITSIGGVAFTDCKLLTSVTLPESLESFKAPGAQYDFGHFTNSGIVSLRIPSKITEIPENFFNGCTNLVSVEFPEGITTWNEFLFRGCASLESVKLPDNMESIPSGFFNECTSLKSFTLPKSVKVIGSSAFSNCSSLAELNFNDVLEEVRDYAFDNTALVDVVFPQSTVMYYNAIFNQCRSLENVTFSPLAQVVTASFSGCEALTSVHMPAGVPPTAGISGGIIPFPIIAAGNNVTLYVPTGSKSAYEADQYWNTFAKIEEEEVDEVVFGIKVSHEGNGSVTVNGATATSETIKIAENSEVVIEFIPNEDWQILSANLNGEDITSLIENNSYTIEQAKSNYTLHVVYERKPVMLTIHSGEAGIIKVPVKYDTPYSLYLEAGENWTIENVYLDGTDVTSQLAPNGMFTTPALRYESHLYITYLSTQSSLAQTATSNAKIEVSGNGVTIRGLNVGDEYSICNVNGTVVAVDTAKDSDVSIQLPANTVYVVKVPGKTFKIAI